MENYKNQTSQEINQALSQEFNKIDKYGYRDDQEMYTAGINIIDKTIKSIKNSKNNYGPWALGPLTTLKTKFKNNFNSLKGCKLFTDNKQLINDIANKIDNAENETLKKLLLNNANRKNRNASLKAEKEKGVKLFNANNDGTITFTKGVNPIKIHDALNGLFTTNQHYKIDYSACTNSRIKEKMTALIGQSECYISFDKDKKTYLVRDSKGQNYLLERALIWEGVKLIPEKTIKFKSYVEERKLNEKKQTINKEQFERYKNLIPKKLRDAIEAKGSEYMKDFIHKTEGRLNLIIRDAKELNYQLHSEPIVKTSILTKGMMEVKLINGNAEKNVIVWENDKIIGKELYNIIDGYESEYKTYLTQRIQEKWNEKEYLTKKEIILEEKSESEIDKKDRLSSQEKTNIIEGLRLLKIFITNHKETEGDSWLDNGDKHIANIISIIKNTEYTLNQGEIFSKKEFQSNVIDPLFVAFHNYTHKIGFITNKVKKVNFNKLFYGKKSEQIDAIRNLSNDEAILDKTESSFLQNEIIDNESTTEKGGTEKLSITNKELDDKFQSIKTEFQLSEKDLNKNIDGSWEHPEKINLINNLYKAAEGKRGEGVLNFLITHNIIPNERKDDKDVRKRCTKLAESLLAQKMIIENNFPETTESLAEKQKREKIALERKENLTETEIQRLQALDFLENHPEEQKKLNQVTIQGMKEELMYGNISSMIRQSLAPIFVEKGDGAKGANAEIYNDIVGYGFFNLSDENAKIAGEILVEIAITVAVAVLTGGTGAAAMAALLRASAGAARAARWANLATKIGKIVEISQGGWKAFKGASIGYKATVGASHLAGLMIEGTIFNSASKIIHNGIKGHAILDDINLNPLQKENLQTAAFLGALSLGKSVGNIPIKIGGKTKLGVSLSKGFSELQKSYPKLAASLKTANNVGAELGAMLIAEQTINLTFGHDILDSVTGEITTERKLRWPDNQEWATMIGIILAFQVIKPNLYGRLINKLNNGTLEIYRTTDPKNPRIKHKATGKSIPLKELPAHSDFVGNNKGENSKNTEQNSKNTEQNSKIDTKKIQETINNIEKELKSKKDRLQKLEIDMEIVKNEFKNGENIIKKIRSEERRARLEENLRNREKEIGQKQLEINQLKSEIENYTKELKNLTTEVQKNKTQHTSENSNTYFEGKKSKLGINEIQARENSKYMDQVLESVKQNGGKLDNSKISEIITKIETEYKIKTGQDITLKTEDIFSIITAHSETGTLGKLTYSELKTKYQKLNSSIKDPKLKRFLLESGYCGKGELTKSTPEQIADFVSEFDHQILGSTGIIHDGKNYKLVFEQNLTQNYSKKGKWKLLVDGSTRFSVNSETRTLPNNSDGNRIRQEYYKLRNEYVDKNIELESKMKNLNNLEIKGGVLDAPNPGPRNTNEFVRVSKKTAFNDFFQSNKELLKGESAWIDGQRRDFTNINQDGALQMKKIVGNGEKPEFRSISSFKQLYDMGQVNGFPDQNSTNGNKYTLSRAEKNRHNLIQETLIKGEKEYLRKLETNTSSEVTIRPSSEIANIDHAISKAVTMIEKQGGLPAIIKKQGGLPAIMEKNGMKGIIPPYWLIPLLIIPGLHLGDGDPIAPTINILKDIKTLTDIIDENPKINGIEFDSDITGPFDSRSDTIKIQKEIDEKFQKLLKENNISEPLDSDTLIILRGVSSWTYIGNGNGEGYNTSLAIKRAQEVQKYLMQKYPILTSDNFIIGSFYQSKDIDEAKRFQGVSMGLLDTKKYQWNKDHLIDKVAGEDGRVL